MLKIFKKKPEPVKEPEKINPVIPKDAVSFLKQEDLIDKYAKIAASQSRGMLTEAQRENVLDNMRWVVTETFNYGYEYGYEQGKQDILAELSRRENGN